MSTVANINNQKLKDAALDEINRLLHAISRYALDEAISLGFFRVKRARAVITEQFALVKTGIEEAMRKKAELPNVYHTVSSSERDLVDSVLSLVAGPFLAQVVDWLMEETLKIPELHEDHDDGDAAIMLEMK
ncbi:hypothetical protein PG999_014132 [Apiospora kogelbergensis]|uniref:Uncharacterized protein n=1 Tax=Apiospora kogelbergensis TaxID=1337665 RepID=A0AAW0QGC9_9PEZI